MEYQRCKCCNEWVECLDVDMLIGVGEVCEKCSDKIRNPKGI